LTDVLQRAPEPAKEVPSERFRPGYANFATTIECDVFPAGYFWRAHGTVFKPNRKKLFFMLNEPSPRITVEATFHHDREADGRIGPLRTAGR